MHRSNRLFEIIQILRASDRPVTSGRLAEMLEVSSRTIYRDIAALQAMGTPVEGEAGLGYMMRRGYDLPPLNFDAEEIEALQVGLSMLARTGDSSLQQAAQRVCRKIDALQNNPGWMQVAPWGAPLDDPALGCVSLSGLRDAIRSERKLRLCYCDGAGHQTNRTVLPVALIYHLECTMLAAWCELRGAFRHFRSDRIHSCEGLDQRFTNQGATLRQLWQQQHSWQQLEPGETNQAS